MPNSVLSCIDWCRARLWPWLCRYLPLVLLFCAMALRLAHYAFNRSLWLDEAMLANNIIDLGPKELLQPVLPSNQSAPLLFLLGVDRLVKWFGRSEMVFRLLPQIAGLLSCWLFFSVARRFLSSALSCVALAMFTFSYQLVYYASEFKQYSVDVAVALLLVWLYLRALAETPVDRRKVWLFGIVGAVVMWLSHPSVFVLAAVGTSAAIGVWRRRWQLPWPAVSGAAILWGGSFVLQYHFFLRHIGGNNLFQEFWKNGFISDYTPWGFVWACGERLLAFASFLHIDIYCGVAIWVLAGVGIGEWCLKRVQKRPAADLLCLLLPFFFTLLAAALHKYSFAYRLTLFLAPFLYLLAACGLQTIAAGRPKWLTPVLSVWLLIPVATSAHQLLRAPIQREEIKPILRQMLAEQQPGDQIYITHVTTPAVTYYHKLLKFKTDNFHWGGRWRNSKQRQNDIDKMSHYRRVWFVFSHQKRYTRPADFLAEFRGKLLEKKVSVGAEIYLYAMDQVSAPVNNKE